MQRFMHEQRCRDFCMNCCMDSCMDFLDGFFKAFLRELSVRSPCCFFFPTIFQLPDSFSLHAAARMCRPWKGLSSVAPKVGLPIGVPAASVHGDQLGQPPGPWAGLSPRGLFPSRFQRGQGAGPGGWCLGRGARSGAQVLGRALAQDPGTSVPGVPGLGLRPQPATKA